MMAPGNSRAQEKNALAQHNSFKDDSFAIGHNMAVAGLTHTSHPNSQDIFKEMRIDLQKSFETFLTNKFIDIETKFADKINEQASEIQALKKELQNINEKSTTIENSIEIQQLEMRKNEILISGHVIPAGPIGENVSQTAIKLFKDHLKINIKLADIVTALRIGNSTTNSNILVKFLQNEVKQDILKAAKTSRIEGFFISDSLTPRNQVIMNTLRTKQLHNKSKLLSMTSRNGFINVYVPNPNHSTST